MVNNDFEVKIISIVHIFCPLKNVFEVKIRLGLIENHKCSLSAVWEFLAS